MSDLSGSTLPAFPGDSLLNRFFLTPEQKSDPEEGRKIIKQFWSQQMSSDSDANFFKARRLKWSKLDSWAKGSQDITEILDFMNISDANKAYLKIDTTQTRIAPQFVETLVESMAKVKVYPCVKAVDNGSLTEKQQRIWDALYRMLEVQTIHELQQESGIQMEPTNAFVPDDELTARVYFELQDKLPKEIRFEKFLEELMNEIRFDTIANRRTLRGIVIKNCGATKLEKISPGNYTVRIIVPNALVYNFFINETGELEVSLIGEMRSEKVKDFRSKFGKSKDNPKGLTEKEIFELAQKSSHQAKNPFAWSWTDNWSNPSVFNQRWPYDDSNIMTFDYEVDFGEDLYYVEKSNDYGQPQIQMKKSAPYQNTKKDGTVVSQPVPAGVSINKRQKNTWMRGVYAPFGDKMLYWGEPDIIVSDYTNVFKPKSSYTVVIPQNDGDYVPSLFERIQDKLNDYQLTTLKRRQIIALVEPDGWTIDVENIKNISLGAGNTISWEQVLRIKNQTGVQLYSSKGIDPMMVLPPPITPGVQGTNIQKIMELTNVLTGLANEMRQLIGVPMYRDGADVGDRTAAALAEGQNTNSFNVTDFTANSNKELWSETFYKYCLIKWNDIVKTEPETKDDILNTRFNVSIQLKSTDYENQRLEEDIQRYSQIPDAQGNPSISPKDAFMLRQIGSDNYKLANWYLSHIFESNRKYAIQESEAKTQQAQAVQAQSAQQTAEQDAALQQQKMDGEKQMKEYEALQQMKVAIVTGSFAIAAKGEGAQFPQWLAPILQQLMPNIQIPIQQENEVMGQQMAAAAQQQAVQAQGQQAPPQQQGGQPMQPQTQQDPGQQMPQQ